MNSETSDDVKALKDKILYLETRLKHLNNELSITKNEYERTANNYFEIYSNMGKKVEDQAELLQTVLDNIPAYVYWKDINQKYLGCNRNFARAMTLPNPIAIIGKTDSQIYSPDEAGEVSNEDASLIGGGMAEFRKVRRHKTPSGKEMWMDIIKVPIHDSEDKIIGMLAVYEDISERVRAEKEQKKLEENMRQSQKLQSLGVLAGGIAHDFNNILTPIIGYAEMAQEDIGEPDKLDFYLQRIAQGSLRAKELVRQILTFSRHSSSKKEPLSMSAVISEAAKLIRATLPATIEIKQGVSSTPGIILGDPTQIHQVIINLCTNAAQAMKDAKGIIEISLSKIHISENPDEFRPGAYILLKVRDNGSGMPPEIIERIFEPFFTTKEVGQGTGMGLSVVHGIIKGLEGYIKVSSSPGEGTEFNIFIPEHETSAVPEKTPKEKSGFAMGKGQNVLLVDDEPIVLETLGKIIKSLNYTLTPCATPFKAIEVFRDAPYSFDLLFTDLTMPGMTGIALAEEILRVRSDIPVVLCSGHGDGVDRKSRGTISAMISKPADRETIAETLHELLKNSGKD